MPDQAPEALGFPTEAPAGGHGEDPGAVGGEPWVNLYGPYIADMWRVYGGYMVYWVSCMSSQSSSSGTIALVTWKSFPV